jgi:rhodanese-related sulfurtransferase
MKKQKNAFMYGAVGIAIIVLVALLFGYSHNQEQLLNGGEFMARYKATQGAVLLDVRTPAEFNAGHIPFAQNLNYEDLAFEQNVRALDTSKTYFVYCRSGNRSGKVVAIMKQNSIKNIYELRGGISAFPELLSQ